MGILNGLLFLVIINLLGCGIYNMGGLPDFIDDHGISIRCNVVNNKDLEMVLVNNTDTTLTISNPCAVNTTLRIYRDNQLLSKQILIRIDPECRNPKLRFLPFEEKPIMNPIGGFSLQDLFKLESNIKYELYLQYFPFPDNDLFIDCKYFFEIDIQ